MNCNRAKIQLALLVGNDLEPASAEEVRKHLAQCSGCRGHFARLSESLEVMQLPVEGKWGSYDDSLWKELSVRLAPESVAQKPHRLNGWAATLAVAAACSAMFFVATRQWSDRPFPGGGGPPQYQQPTDNPPSPLDELPNSDEYAPRRGPLDEGSSRRFDPSERTHRSTAPAGVPVIPVKQ
jgi:Putative zinc-finger